MDSKEILCKLVSQTLTTYNDTLWVPGEWRETSGQGELCSNGWLHGYTHPLLAALLNPIHANIRNPRLFLIEIAGYRKDDKGLKFGATKMRLTTEISLPALTTEQKVKFGILCVLPVVQNQDFVQWAHRWLSGVDRSAASAAWAAAAARAARAADAEPEWAWAARTRAAWKAAAAEAAAAEAAAAARAAAEEAAAEEAVAVAATVAATVAAEAAEARAAARAAEAAAQAAPAALASGKGIDLIAIAKEACNHGL
jgi:hypothetical protein